MAFHSIVLDVVNLSLEFNHDVLHGDEINCLLWGERVASFDFHQLAGECSQESLHLELLLVVVQVCWEPPYAVVPAVASRWEVPSKCCQSLGVPYAVVPADASRWGPIVEWVTLWVVLGPYGHAVFPQPLIRQ